MTRNLFGDCTKLFDLRGLQETHRERRAVICHEFTRQEPDMQPPQAASRLFAIKRLSPIASRYPKAGQVLRVSFYQVT